jgi:hypothetical protein
MMHVDKGNLMKKIYEVTLQLVVTDPEEDYPSEWDWADLIGNETTVLDCKLVSSEEEPA